MHTANAMETRTVQLKVAKWLQAYCEWKERFGDKGSYEPLDLIDAFKAGWDANSRID